MTVGAFHDAAAAAVAAAGRHGAAPRRRGARRCEDARRRAAAVHALAAHLRNPKTAADGSPADGHGSVAVVADQLMRVPSLGGQAGLPEARHPLAGSCLAAAAAVGLERDVLAASGQALTDTGRRWLTSETLQWTVLAARGLQLFAHRLQPLRTAIATDLDVWARAVVSAARHADAELAPVSAEAANRVRAMSTRLDRSRQLVDALPEELQRPFARVLAAALHASTCTPPDAAALRATNLVITASCAALRQLADKRGPSGTPVAKAWHAAQEHGTRTEAELVAVATLGRRDPALQAAARDCLTALDRVRRPAPDPTGSATVTSLTAAVEELASQQRRIITKLGDTGGLYAPRRLLCLQDLTRWERHHVGSRWLPMSSSRAASLASTYTEGSRLIRVASRQNRPPAVRSQRRQSDALAPSALEQLARSHLPQQPLNRAVR